MKAKDVLTKAKQLIADPARWGQGVYMQDAHGNEVDPCDVLENEAATPSCFCALGAVMMAAGEWNEDRGVARPATLLLREALGEERFSTLTAEGVAAFNDSHTHEEVLALFDKAIELAEEAT